jgi:hypothetical protein
MNFILICLNLLLSIGFAFLATPSTLADQCTSILSPDQVELINTCDDGINYSFSTSEEFFTISKKIFQKQLDSQIRSWWQRQQLRQSFLVGSRVEVWITMPDSSPASYQLRAIVYTQLGRVGFGFDVREENWVFGDANTGILAESSYPETFGWRPQTLLIQVSPTVSNAEAEQVLRLSGIALEEEISPGWYNGRTRAFDEENAVLRLRRVDKEGYFIKSVLLNRIVEWVGYRGKGFEYEGRFND